MSRHWYTVKDFPKNIFVDPDGMIKHLQARGESWILTTRDQSLYTPEVKDWFKHYGLIVSRCIIFYRCKDGDHGSPHVDLERVTAEGEIVYTSSGINVEMCGSSVMEFFDGDAKKCIQRTTPFGQPYLAFDDIENCNVIDSLDFSTGTCLVRTDIVHFVRSTSTPRALASFRFRTIFDNKELSWNETISLLKPVLVEE
jgi:hypothetical protein